MHAVHPSKGCYLGQEIVERVRSRGHVNKMIAPLEIETAEVRRHRERRSRLAERKLASITSAAFSAARG